jgi:hypothetical protein
VAQYWSSEFAESSLRSRKVEPVVQNISTVTGTVGYLAQLERARRFLGRVMEPPESWDEWNEVTFQDDMWAFFQNCWHVKDWLKKDPVVDEQLKAKVIDAAHRSPKLKICRELCNGTKHFKLDKQGAAATHSRTTIRIEPGAWAEIDCMFDDGQDNELHGKQLAQECIAEWESILLAHKLPIRR